MVKLNHHYTKLAGGYLFSEIDKRVAAVRKKKPASKFLNLGIGDIQRPLTPTLAQALENASREMGKVESFKGYGPFQGYSFLREAIAKTDYSSLSISPDEIFISNGINEDICNIAEIFAMENKIAVPDPSYPAYLEANVMAGRTRALLKTGVYGGVAYLPCNEKNNFMPEPPTKPCDLIYLCSPSNPTGVALDRATLTKWVNYARENKAVILFDGAYEAYIRTPGIPRSIYEIEGAKEVAIEFRSFSKTAGFTGLRCSYTVIPHALKFQEGYRTFSLHAFWSRRQDTKTNGVAYPIQRAAAAVYTPEGQNEIRSAIDSYLAGAKTLREHLLQKGYCVYGGLDAPYVWIRTQEKISSWDFFDRLLTQQIIGVPGEGFGREGKYFLRLSTFGGMETIMEAIERFKSLDLFQ